MARGPHSQRRPLLVDPFLLDLADLLFGPKEGLDFRESPRQKGPLAAYSLLDADAFFRRPDTVRPRLWISFVEGPRCQARPAARGHPHPQAEVLMSQSPAGKSVLVVDDDHTAREITALLLQGQGYAVACARNGREALGLLRAYPPPPDLIVLDLWMPGMNGWQFRQQQRADPALAAIPVLVVSAVADAAQQDGTLGEVTFLQKPAAPEALFAAVARCVAGPLVSGT
jgi:CheY-like chemotaxis protein